MSHTDTEIEAMATAYNNGIPADQLDGAVNTPGSLAWLLDVVDDWDAFTSRATAENLSAEDLVRKAVDAYLHAA